MTFQAGSIIASDDLLNELKQSRQNLVNIDLFNQVAVNIEAIEGAEVWIVVSVKEMWYTYPGLSLQIADRNFNSWYQEHNHDWNRLEYGMRFYQLNCRGRDEDLKLVCLLGFSKQFEAGYTIPYFDSLEKLGVKLNVKYTEDKMINYQTEDNHEAVFQDFSTGEAAAPLATATPSATSEGIQLP